MRTIIPYANLEKDSWAEDFTPPAEIRQNYMYVQCVGHYRALPGYGVYDRSDLQSYLLLYTSHGCGRVRFRGKELALPPGYATLIDCREPHSYYCEKEEAWDFRWIHFAGDPLLGYLTDFFQHWGIAPNPLGTAFFQELYGTLKKGDPASYITCSSDLMKLCSDLLLFTLQSNTSPGSRISPVVSSAIKLLEAEFREDIDLTYVCQKLSVSKFYFLRTFKEQTGFTPNEYLITLRLNHAKSLLRSTLLTIEEIALECGFTTSTYFIQVFKKKENVTPLHYRKYFSQNVPD